MSEYLKIGDVCKRTDTQPYVLRFWESEFPQLAPNRNPSGQTVYTDDDVALIQRIKQLLYEEEYTIAGARKLLEQESRKSRHSARPAPEPASAEPAGSSRERSRPAPAKRTRPAPRATAAEPGLFPSSPATVERERYDNAVHEIQRLRRQIEDLASERDEQTIRIENLEQALEASSQRAQRVAERLERLLETLG